MQSFTRAVFTLLFVAAPVLRAGQPAPVIEFSKPLPPARVMGTAFYAQLEKEKTYAAKITEKHVDTHIHTAMPKAENMSDEEWAKIQKEEAAARAKLIPVKDYELVKQSGEYVGWFGIVREIKTDANKKTALLLEHRFFDGLVDLDLHIVSTYGAGDFTALFPTKPDIKPLSLVCIYGKVSKSTDGAPVVTPEYVRVWDWGLFTFMEYGLDKGNKKWNATRKIAPKDAYENRPMPKYYESVLGKRE